MAANRTGAARAARRRRSRLRRRDHDLSAEPWRTLEVAWEGARTAEWPTDRGSVCILPISRGGRYTLDNVVPACRSCNASKCNDEVTAWTRRRRHDERTFLLRLREMQISIGQRSPGVATSGAAASSENSG